MNLYHIKLTDHQKAALEHLFSLDIAWNKTELEKAWQDLREHIADVTQSVAIINAIKPKYDPCRPFKKGDRVAPKFWNDRPPVASEERANSEFLPEDGIYTVLANERNSITFIDYHGKRAFIPVNHLELVTPVEELVPYFTKEDGVGLWWEVWKRDEEDEAVLVVSFNANSHPNPKEAAEAECARLNAEYRKEQCND